MTHRQLNNTRLKLKMTLPEFAVYLNTPVGTVKHWLYGTRRIPGIVSRFLNAVGVI